MKYIKCLIFILPLLFISCGEKDEPRGDLFSMFIELEGDCGEVQLIKHECEVTVNGEQQYIRVNIIGDFDKLDLLPSYGSHEWSMVTFGEKTMSISVLANNTGDVRSDNVDFVLSRGAIRNEGTISIVQLPKTDYPDK